MKKFLEICLYIIAVGVIIGGVWAGLYYFHDIAEIIFAGFFALSIGCAAILIIGLIFWRDDEDIY